MVPLILTITLNPALDKLVAVPALRAGEANRVELLSTQPAGKGVDVAKVLRDMEAPVCATGFLGGAVASVFNDFLFREGIENAFVPIAGSTRTNLQIFGGDGARTELLEQGPSVTSDEWDALLDVLDSRLPRCGAAALCGSAPGGVSPAMAQSLLRRMKAAGGIAAADLSGPLLRAALAEKPDLIKPNRSEMCELMGQPGASDEAIRAYAVRLVADGIPYVLVSLGGDGALLACRDGVWRCKAPDVPVKSTLGCGDTMVASLLLSLLEQAAPAEMLRRAVALSSANAMTFETAHIQPETYRELLPLCTADRLI